MVGRDEDNLRRKGADTGTTEERKEGRKEDEGTWRDGGGKRRKDKKRAVYPYLDIRAHDVPRTPHGPARHTHSSRQVLRAIIRSIGKTDAPDGGGGELRGGRKEGREG